MGHFLKWLVEKLVVQKTPFYDLIIKNLLQKFAAKIEFYFRVFDSRYCRPCRQIPVNSLHANCLFLYPLKTSEKLWFSVVPKGYR